MILDVVGAKYLQQNVDALADYGRLIVIGLQGGTKAETQPRASSSASGRPSSARRCGRGPVAEKGVIMYAVRESVWPHAHRRQDPAAGGQVLPPGPGARSPQYFDSGDCAKVRGPVQRDAPMDTQYCPWSNHATVIPYAVCTRLGGACMPSSATSGAICPSGTACWPCSRTSPATAMSCGSNSRTGPARPGR